MTYTIEQVIEFLAKIMSKDLISIHSIKRALDKAYPIDKNKSINDLCSELLLQTTQMVYPKLDNLSELGNEGLMSLIIINRIKKEFPYLICDLNEKTSVDE